MSVEPNTIAASPPSARAPEFFEFSGDLAAGATAQGQLSAGWRLADGQHSWAYRAQNFAITLTWLRDNEVLEAVDIPDEHAVLIPGESAVRIEPDSGDAVAVAAPAFVVVPPGTSHIVGATAGFVIRVFTARLSKILESTFNNGSYTTANERVRPLPPLPAGASAARSTVQVHVLADVPDEPGRLGRIFRTDSLMINWFAPQIGPRDTNQLTPHSHEDFEQASVTLAGEYVHHVRRPWTARLSDWRPDEHVHVYSPSVTIIPPGNVHTTRAIGDGIHQLIDVFAPPREDFIDNGWVLNQSAYDASEPSA